MYTLRDGESVEYQFMEKHPPGESSRKTFTGRGGPHTPGKRTSWAGWLAGLNLDGRARRLAVCLDCLVVCLPINICLSFPPLWLPGGRARHRGPHRGGKAEVADANDADGAALLAQHNDSSTSFLIGLRRKADRSHADA